MMYKAFTDFSLPQANPCGPCSWAAFPTMPRPRISNRSLLATVQSSAFELYKTTKESRGDMDLSCTRTRKA